MVQLRSDNPARALVEMYPSRRGGNLPLRLRGLRDDVPGSESVPCAPPAGREGGTAMSAVRGSDVESIESRAAKENYRFVTRHFPGLRQSSGALRANKSGATPARPDEEGGSPHDPSFSSKRFREVPSLA